MTSSEVRPGCSGIYPVISSMNGDVLTSQHNLLHLTVLMGGKVYLTSSEPLVLICVCCLSASHLSPWLPVLTDIPVDPGGFCHVPPEPSLLPTEPASVSQPLFMEQRVQPQSSWLPLLNSSLFTAASHTEGLKLDTVIHVT